MRAYGAPTYGPIDSIKEVDLPEPQPGPGEVRVRVIASALNLADYKVTVGKFKFLHGRTKPLVVGYDFSGPIDAVGPGVTEHAVGDEVFGFLPYRSTNKQGAFAEKLVARVDAIAKKPARVSHTDAAASASTAITALQSIRDLGRAPAEGARVLVTGVSGAVGSISIGVARRLGATVTAVGSGAGLEVARKLGASVVLDRTKQALPGGLADRFHVVFDAAGVAYRWSAWRKNLEPGGAFVTTQPSAGFVLDTVSSLFTSTRCKMVFIAPRAADLALLGSWLDDGLEVPLVDTIPVRDVAAGLLRIKQSGGRIAVRVADAW